MTHILSAASGGSTLDAASDFQTRRDTIAGRSHPKDHCPVYENGQAHGPSAASGAEKVPATPGQEQEHAASRPAEPKAVKKAWGRPLQHRDYRGQHWSVQVVTQDEVFDLYEIELSDEDAAVE